MTEREYLVALYSFISFGPARTKLLISYFGSAKNVWKANKKELLGVGLKEKTAGGFVNYRQKFDAKDYFNRLKKYKISFVTVNDLDYPKNLIDLDDAPQVLYVRGELKASDINAVAIVGTRKMTSYGKEVARKFAYELAGVGVTIVSGLAFGIDAVAHKATLEAQGRTIAVLASGLDIITPVANLSLAKEIVKKGGAIVSEYCLGRPPLRTSFPSRNRIISGLSKAVVVIEGAKKSGTLLTASAAANQGRQVFAVPGQITSPMSGAPHFLIANGAKMITCAQDILEELDMQLKVDREAVERVMPSDEIELKLLKILENESLHLDEVVRKSLLNTSEVSAKLIVMELKGMVKNVGGGTYKKC